MLPGSRGTELRQHVPALLNAYQQLKLRRPHLGVIAGAADERAERMIREAAIRRGMTDLQIVRGTRQTIAQADAAWVASGTAVLECALSGVPAVALYIVSRSVARHARRVYSGRFVTIPNLVLQREVIPELLQEDATPAALARAMDDLLRDPQRQYAQFAQLREALGPSDALERCAAYAVQLAKGA
jgi:lipid-A-disaccharide synthase